MTIDLKQDFYAAVNDKWLNEIEIPSDKPAIGSFQVLANEIEVLLMKDVAEMADGQREIPNELMAAYLDYYRLASDFETREKVGVAPLLTELAKIEALESFADLNAQLQNWVLEDLPLPVKLAVDADMKNATTHTLYANVPGLILPDTTYYEGEHPNRDELLAAYQEMLLDLFAQLGWDKARAEAVVRDDLAFDSLLAPHMRSAEESADYSKIYNPTAFADFTASSKTLDLAQLVKTAIGQEPAEVIVSEPKFYQALDTILTPENFTKMKHWMMASTVWSYGSLLTEEFRLTAAKYNLALSGAAEALPQAKAAFFLANTFFDQILGNYYSQTYFGAAAKQDVEEMVANMIKIYQKRLQANTWLSEETRAKAIVKLGKLGVQVGYPAEIPALYKQFQTVPAAQGGSLVANANRFKQIYRAYNFSLYGQPVDRDEWEMSADTVNAYYHPFKNIIVFPAAILQAPFYSLEQTRSQNYGGIGAVIAHEISHAFDNNGAKFDEYGNLNNWWNEDDLAHFESLSQAMIAQFDGVEFTGGKVNGTLTVSENIADVGGISCALEATKLEEDADLKEFFISWATIWRNKAQAQYQALLLAIDVHSPAKLRVNIQVTNFPEFYESFDITSEDEMYLAPAKRVTIW